jgi:hypothetical protein
MSLELLIPAVAFRSGLTAASEGEGSAIFVTVHGALGRICGYVGSLFRDLDVAALRR